MATGKWVFGLFLLACGLNAAAQTFPAEGDGSSEDAGVARELGLGTVELPPAESSLPDTTLPVPVIDEAPLRDPAALDPADGGRSEGDPGVPPGPSRETVVVGSRPEQTSGSLHILREKELQRFERDDPHAILKAVPGVYVRGEDGFGLRPNVAIRGGNSDRSKKVTLLEDGVLFGPAPYTAPAAYYFPLMTRMRSVRVLKGPSALTQGPQTVGGAVELLTHEVMGEGGRLVLDGSAGRFGAAKLHGHYSFGSGGTGLLIEGVHLRSGGFKEVDLVGGETGFSRNEWMAKAKRTFSIGSARHSLQLKAGYSDELSHETYLGLTDVDLAAAPNRRYLGSALDRMHWTRTQLVLHHELSAEALSIVTDVYRHHLDRTWRKLNRFRGAAVANVLANPQSPRNELFYRVLTGAADSSSPDEALMIGPNHRVFVSQGVQSALRLEGATGPISHALEAGARLHHDRIGREHTEDAFLVRGGELVAEGGTTLTTARSRASTDALSLHALDAARYGRFTLTAGSRVELLRSSSTDSLAGTTGEGRTVVLLPGGGLHAEILPGLGAFAGVHRGFSPPEPGVPGAQPELSVNYELGARYTGEGFNLEAIGFFSDYQNLTTSCTFSTGCTTELDRQFSAGAAQIRGAELSASRTVRAAGNSFPLQLAYTLTKTELLQSFTSADPQLGRVTAGDELPYVPLHQLHASVGFERGQVGLFGSATYVGELREQAGAGPIPEGSRVPSLLTFDAAAHVRLVEGVKVYATAQNLLGTRALQGRRPFGARPNAPTLVQLGISYSD